MAKEILKNYEVILGGTDISNYCKTVTLDGEIELKDTTGAGDENRTFAPGFKTAKGSINGITDLATIEPLLNTIWISSAPGSASLSLLPKKGTAVGVANPKRTGTVQFSTIPLIGLDIENPPPMNLSFNVSGALTRATS